MIDERKVSLKKTLKNLEFFQDQSLSPIETAASRKRSGFEDLGVAKMQILGKRTVLQSLLVHGIWKSTIGDSAKPSNTHMRVLS